jgi:hypothetical protein
MTHTVGSAAAKSGGRLSGHRTADLLEFTIECALGATGWPRGARVAEKPDSLPRSYVNGCSFGQQMSHWLLGKLPRLSGCVCTHQAIFGDFCRTGKRDNVWPTSRRFSSAAKNRSTTSIEPGRTSFFLTQQRSAAVKTSFVRNAALRAFILLITRQARASLLKAPTP